MRGLNQSETANARRAPTLKSPERAEKIAAARRGKPRPAHVIAAIVKAHKDKPIGKAQRQKMSDAHKRRGTYPQAAGRPFTREEDTLLGTAMDREIAERIGRDVQTVFARRKRLGIVAFRKR